MGKQIAIIASRVDEQTFLAHLREQGPIQIFRRAADSEAELWLERFGRYGPLNKQYFIWNKDYAWRPRVVPGRPELGGGKPWFRVDNYHSGPVIEFCRTDMAAFLREGPGFWCGRIYWPAYNRQTGFKKWFESPLRGVRRNGHVLTDQGASECYCLPDAWRLWQVRKAVR